MTNDTNKTKPARAKRFARQPAEGLNGSASSPQAEATAPPPKVSKTDAVIALLRRDEGATLAEITGATGWLPHSARAALTGLRKKGHVLDKTKRGEVTCYTLPATT